MKISVFPAYGSINSKPVFDAFIQNLKDKKENYKINSYDDDTDVAVIWSVLWQGRMRSNRNIWEQFKKRNKPVVVLEVGGIKRNITWKVGINGINRDADFANETFDDKRWKKFDIQMKPWQQDGKNIIICGQHDTSEQWKNLPRMNNWLLEQITKIKKYTDRPIIVRPHPRNPIRIKMEGVKTVTPIRDPRTYDDTDFVSSLQNAWAVVNHSSNPAMQSVFNGVPVYVSESSLSHDVGNTDYANIENPNRPDRTQWANKLAFTEWWIDEIKQGIPWQRLREKIQK